MKIYLIVLFSVVILVGIRLMVSAARSEAEERHWIPGTAEILEVKDSGPISSTPGSSHLYVVRARMWTPDGRQTEGWASGHYSDSMVDRWRGRPSVHAWYDPQDPSQFRLAPPRSPRGVATGLAVPVLMLAVVAVMLAVVVLLTLRFGIDN
ncbi:MAG: DUF3592 domain-containing protein [Actinomycetales bacterium]|nr:DUF3592 domain-containing protein [Actinomycetales bacterium]